jgi:hypothetical protein
MTTTLFETNQHVSSVTTQLVTALARYAPDLPTDTNEFVAFANDVAHTVTDLNTMWICIINALDFATIAVGREFETALRRSATAALGLY